MASLLKNVASQNITFTLVSATTGAALTSATFTSLAWVTKDNTQAGFAGTFTTLGNGQYNYAPTQAETNCTDFGLLVTVSGAIPVNLDFHTDLATPLTGAQIATAVWTDTTAGDFTTALSVGKSVMNGVSLGTGLTINGYTGNTPQTGDSYARIGAAGAGLTAITGVTLATSQPGVTIPTVTTVTNQLTAAAIATGVWQDATSGDFTVASSVGKALYIANIAPGAAGGHFIAGSNAATTVNFTGNLSGSVGSVTGAVGSVTGNVGGNVVGSVASVTGAVGSVTGNVGGNVVGSVASVTAQVTANTTSWGGTSVSAVPPDLMFTRNGTAQAGSTSTITLDAGASATNGYYTGQTVFIRSGTGAGQSTNITGYTGSSKIAAVGGFATAPDNTSVFSIAAFGPVTATISGGVNVTQWGGTSVGGVPPDVIFTRSGTAQAGAASTITLDSGASATNSFYDNQTIFIRSGTGAGQSAVITAYVGATKVATVGASWATNPDSTSVFTVAAFGPSAATVSGTVNANVTQWNGSAVATPNVSGVPIVDLKYTLGTISPAAAGYIGVDWGQVTNKTTTNALTGTTISSSQVVASVTGAAGSVTGLTPATIATGVWQDTTAGDFTVSASIGKSVLNGVSLGTGLTINGYTGNTPQTGDSYARIGAAGASLTAITGVTLATSQPGVTIPTVTTVTNQLTAAAIATGVWQDSTSGDFTAASSIGKSLGGAFTALGTSVYSTASLANAPTGGSAPTVAQIATGVWQDTTAGDFTVASSIGKSLFTSGAVPGGSGGLFIAGSNAATTVNFTGNLSGSVGSVTGNVGGNVVGSAASVTGSVGSISGVTFPTNFSSLSINGSGYVTITSDIKQGVSATVVFTMTDSTTHAPKTGIGSSFTRNEIYKGGGAGAGTTNMPSEVGDGWYSVVLTASETNATSIALTFEASGADQLNMLLIPQA